MQQLWYFGASVGSLISHVFRNITQTAGVWSTFVALGVIQISTDAREGGRDREGDRQKFQQTFWYLYLIRKKEM